MDHSEGGSSRPLAQAYVKMLRAVGARDTDKAREFADRIRQPQEGLQELPSDINPADVALVVMERSANGNGQEDRGVQAFRAALEELEEDVMPLIEEYLGGNQGQEQLDYMSNLTFGGRSFDIPATHGPVAWVKVATMLWEMFSGFSEADDEKEE